MKKNYILMSFLALTLMFSFGFASIKNVGATECIIPSSGGTGSTNNGPMDCSSGGTQCNNAGGTCSEIIRLKNNKMTVIDNLNNLVDLNWDVSGVKQIRGLIPALKINDKTCYTKKESSSSRFLGKLF